MREESTHPRLRISRSQLADTSACDTGTEAAQRITKVFGLNLDEGIDIEMTPDAWLTLMQMPELAEHLYWMQLKGVLPEPSLTNTNLSNRIFAGLNVGRLKMEQVLLVGTRWLWSSLGAATFGNCNFRSADMVVANFSNSTLTNCSFHMTTLRDTRFEGCTFVDCDFYGVRVHDAVFHNCRFVRPRLSSELLSCVSRGSRFEDVEGTLYHRSILPDAVIATDLDADRYSWSHK